MRKARPGWRSNAGTASTTYSIGRPAGERCACATRCPAGWGQARDACIGQGLTLNMASRPSRSSTLVLPSGLPLVLVKSLGQASTLSSPGAGAGARAVSSIVVNTFESTRIHTIDSSTFIDHCVQFKGLRLPFRKITLGRFLTAVGKLSPFFTGWST